MKPKRIMHPCTCGSKYVECNCKMLTERDKLYLYIPFMVFAICVVIVGLRYLFGG